MPILPTVRQLPVPQGGELAFINREARPVLSQVRDHINAEAVPPVLTHPLGGIVTLDWQRNRSYLLALTSDQTVVKFGTPDNCGDYRLVVYQGGAFTITGWPATVIWPGGSPPVFTDARSYVSFYYDGTQWFGRA